MFQTRLHLLPSAAQRFWLIMLKSLWLGWLDMRRACFPLARRAPDKARGWQPAPSSSHLTETLTLPRCRLLPLPGGAGLRASGLPAGAGAEPALCRDGLQRHCMSRDSRTWWRGEWVGWCGLPQGCRVCSLLSPRRQYWQAEAQFSMAIEHNPQKPLYYLCWARAHLCLRRVESAREDAALSQHLWLDPADGKVQPCAAP